jgi:predicted SprT family Zn-dependent metalloprotease
MKIRVPSKRVCEEFRLIYELRGAQAGVDFLTEYYGIRRMGIIVNGRRISKKKSWRAEYYRAKGYFKRSTLNKSLVLHELAHHIVACDGLKVKRAREEKLANDFVRNVIKSGRWSRA